MDFQKNILKQIAYGTIIVFSTAPNSPETLPLRGRWLEQELTELR
jgi:hypothetical protein